MPANVRQGGVAFDLSKQAVLHQAARLQMVEKLVSAAVVNLMLPPFLDQRIDRVAEQQNQSIHPPALQFGEVDGQRQPRKPIQVQPKIKVKTTNRTIQRGMAAASESC